MVFKISNYALWISIYFHTNFFDFFYFFRNRYLTNIKFILMLSLIILTSKNFLRIYNNLDYKPYPEIKNKSEYFKAKK